jgi:hypothetical protein
MKKAIFILLSFILLLSGCNKNSSSNTSNSTVSEIKSEVVYYQNGKEAAFNGDVILWHGYEHFFGTTINIGTVENGKLSITLPDIDTIDGVPPNRIEKIQPFFDDLDIKVIPEDAEWFAFKHPLNPNSITSTARIVVFSDDKERNIWNRDEIVDIYYVLDLSDDSDTTQLIWVFFTKDTTIKGNKKLSMFGFTYEYDIDIKVKRGWNKIYVDESESSIIVKSTPKSKQDFKWTTSRTQLNIW